MKYPDVIEQLSKELDIQKEVVDAAYKSFFSFIRETIVALPLKENLSEEEFNSIRTNFNIPAIGKLHCTYERYLGMKKRQEYIKKLKEENEVKKD